MERHIQIISGNVWFKDFPLDVLTELAAAGKIRHYKDKQTIFRVGDRPSGIDIILQGGVRSSSISPDGHEFTFSLLKPGALVGLVSCLDGSGVVNNAIAHGDTRVFALPRDDLMKVLARQPELYGHFVRMLCYRMRKAYSVIDELTLVPIRQRIARQLCTLVFAEYGPQIVPGDIDLAITQSDLAVLLGVTRAVVNRVLKELQDEGLVRAHYGRIVVRDFSALHARCAERRLFSM